MNRTLNSIKNFSSGVGAYVVTSLANFVLRKIFTLKLGTSCLGINGLFLTIISALSVAELGFGTAIIFSLYEPIANENYKIISAIMRYYKKVYRIIALAVASLGCLVIPFLPLLLNGYEAEYNPYLVYGLFLITTVSSYLLSYKKSIYYAYQRQHVVTSGSCLFTIARILIQCIVLVFFENYYLYLLAGLFETIIANLYFSQKASSEYSQCFEHGCEINNSLVKTIKKNVGALVLHRIGGVAVNSTDNILLSSLTKSGIVSVGLYSNYQMVTSVLVNVCGQIFSGITASYGNLSVVGSNDSKVEIYWITNFVAAWVYGFCSICLLILFNPFIELIFGNEYVFENSIVLIIVLNFYISGMRKPNLMVSEAMGLYWFDRYKPVAEACINLITSIVLAKYFDILGVFIGTTISTVLTGFWIEPVNIAINGFGQGKKHVLKYFVRYFTYFITMLIAYCIILLITKGIDNFIFKLCVCAIIPNAIFTIVYAKTFEFSSLIRIIKGMLHKKIIK